MRKRKKQNDETLQHQLEEERKCSTQLLDNKKSLEMQVEISQKHKLELQGSLDEMRRSMKKNEEALWHQLEEEKKQQNLVHDEHMQDVSIKSCTCKFGYNLLSVLCTSRFVESMSQKKIGFNFHWMN